MKKCFQFGCEGEKIFTFLLLNKKNKYEFIDSCKMHKPVGWKTWDERISVKMSYSK